MLEFVWDERKNAANRRKHGVSFVTAARVFDDPRAVSYVERVVEGEVRWQTIGLVGGVIFLLVAHTVEENYGTDVSGQTAGQETIRIISARKADRRERNLYEAATQD